MVGAVARMDDVDAGLFYSSRFRDGRTWNGYEHNRLMRNDGLDSSGRLRFTEVAAAVGVDDIRDGRGLATLDFDNDGDLDILVTNRPVAQDQPDSLSHAILYRNNIGQKRNWLAVELTGRKCNRDAIGAIVTIQTADLSQLRYLSAGSGHASQHGDRLYFGLDQSDYVDRLSVRWPNGETESFEHIKSCQLVRIEEGRGMVVGSLPGRSSR